MTSSSRSPAGRRTLPTVLMLALALSSAPALPASGQDLPEAGGLCPAGAEPLSADNSADGDLDEGESACFSIELDGEPDVLLVELQGPIGREADFDLYVRWERPPSRLDHDCRSTSGTSEEACVFDVPKLGTWYAAVVAESGGGSFQIGANASGCEQMALGEARRGVVDFFEFDCFVLDLPPGEDVLRVEVSGSGDEDADVSLRTKSGDAPSWRWDLDCYSFSLGNEDACLHPQPSAGPWWVLVEGAGGRPAYEVVASTEPCTVLPADGTPATADASGRRVDCFRTDLQSGDILRASIEESGGADTSLVLYEGAEALCEVQDAGASAEACVELAPAPGAWYAVARYFDVPAVGGYSVAFLAEDAEPVDGLLTDVVIDGTHDFGLFRLDADEAEAVLALHGPGDADFNLYARRGAPARDGPFGDWECASERNDSTEFCALPAAEGPVYVMVWSFEGSGAATLAATTL